MLFKLYSQFDGNLASVANWQVGFDMLRDVEQLTFMHL